MDMTENRRRRARSVRPGAIAVAFLLVLVGCQEGSAPPEGGPGTVAGGTSVGVQAGSGGFGTVASAAVGQTCTDEWRRRGHTTQREAKAFLTQCLAGQGVQEQRLSAADVMTLLERAIPASSALTTLVPADIATFCPAYARQDPQGRADFWRGLLLAMVGPESGFRTTASLWEEGGLQQFSIGLLQLSYTDRQSHGCDFGNEADIADPARNLSCGVRIMTGLVGENGAIGARSGNRWLGGARYWSVLRTTSDARTGIIRATSSLPSCQAG